MGWHVGRLGGWPPGFHRSIALFCQDLNVPPAMAYFSADALVHLREAQRALLSLDADGDLATWAVPAFAPLRRLFQTDHVFTVAPDAGGEGLSVCHPAADEAFADGIRGEFVGFEDGFTRFREAYPTGLHQMLRLAGPGAYHDAPFIEGRARESHGVYHGVLRPARVERQLAAAVPLGRGEALLEIGYGTGDMPDVGAARHAALDLLLPAFEAGVRVREIVGAAARREAAALDASGAAVLAVDADGAERHRTPALGRLTAAETEGAALLRPAAAFALAHAQGGGAASRTVTLAGSAYALRAAHDGAALGAPGVLVFVERTSALPPGPALEARFGLTPREAEVALLLAEGRTDKEVADLLFISPHTARRHAERVLKKVGVSTRSAVAYVCLTAWTG